MSEIILISFLAAVLSLDITAFGQFMVSRPIVSAPLVGYLLGDVNTGLWIGMTVELIWISAIPMGAAIPIDTTAVAILSVAYGLKVQPFDRAGVILALVVAVGVGILFRKADVFIRYLNIKIIHWVEDGVKDGKEGRIGLGIYSGMFLFFLKSFVLYLLAIYPGQAVVRFIYHYLNAQALAGLRFAWLLLPVLGMGLMFVNFRSGKFPCNKIEDNGGKKQ